MVSREARQWSTGMIAINGAKYSPNAKLGASSGIRLDDAEMLDCIQHVLNQTKGSMYAND
jgi:hypothetical protein